MPACKSGYAALVNNAFQQVGDGEILNCLEGQLTPPTFSCAPVSCDAPTGIEFAAEPSCFEGWGIGHGGRCGAKCIDGYSPNPMHLACTSAQLNPSSFTCQPSECSAPDDILNVADAGPCAEGDVISHNQKCTPQCLFGYDASVQQLVCQSGKLAPPTFTCRDVTLLSPQSVAAVALAPLVNPASATSTAVMAAFVDWYQGLVTLTLSIDNGVVQAKSSDANDVIV
jgi:hypothetical protein